MCASARLGDSKIQLLMLRVFAHSEFESLMVVVGVDVVYIGNIRTELRVK